MLCHPLPPPLPALCSACCWALPYQGVQGLTGSSSVVGTANSIRKMGTFQDSFKQSFSRY